MACEIYGCKKMSKYMCIYSVNEAPDQLMLNLFSLWMFAWWLVIFKIGILLFQFQKDVICCNHYKYIMKIYGFYIDIILILAMTRVKMPHGGFFMSWFGIYPNQSNIIPTHVQNIKQCTWLSYEHILNILLKLTASQYLRNSFFSST